MIVTDNEIVHMLAINADPWGIAETLCAQEVNMGEYEGCSSELEMAFTAYENRAKRLLAVHNDDG